MVRGHDRQPARAGFENSNRRTFAIAVFCFDGMLHEGARVAHLLLNDPGRLYSEEGDGAIDAQVGSQLSTVVQQWTIANHAQPGVRVRAEGFRERTEGE